MYGFGDIIVGIRLTVFQFYLLPFYTDVVLLTPALAGVAKMIGLAWDGLNDPLTGFVSDTTRTRFGRRRPFLLLAALPIGVTFAMLWTPPGALGPMGRFVYLVVAYLLLDTCFTLYSTPYYALGAELSSDYHERTQLAAARGLFHVFGLFAGGVIPGLVIAQYADSPATGFIRLGLGMGAFMTAVALLTGLVVREPPVTETSGRSPSWGAFVHGLRTSLGNRPFRIMLGTFAVIMVGGGLNQTLVPYVMRYWLARPDVVGSVVAVYLTASLASLPLWTQLGRRLGKDRALRLCMLWAAFALAMLPVVLFPGMSDTLLAGLLALAGLGNGGWIVLAPAIMADIIDHDELETTERREGAYFGLWTLAMKFAQALASGVIGVALQLLDYTPNQVQAGHTLLGIKVLYGPVPAGCMLLAFVVFWRFPLTRQRHAEVQAALMARRG